MWNGVGIWVKTLEIQFGWSRAQLTGAFSLAQLEGSLIGPLMGYLIDRLGAKRMVLIGLIVTGLGFVIFSQTLNVAMFYFSYSLIMLGTAAGTWLPMMTILNRWFSRMRGRAMSVAGEGSFLGGLLLVPALAWSVDPDNLGWRATAFWIGLGFIAIAWPISKIIRERPEDYGQLPDGDPIVASPAVATRAERVREAEPAGASPDFTARQAIRTHAFWFITFGHALSSMLIANVDSPSGTHVDRSGTDAANGGFRVVGAHGGGGDLPIDRRLRGRQDTQERLRYSGSLLSKRSALSWRRLSTMCPWPWCSP